MIYVRILHLYAFVTKYDIGPSSQRYNSIPNSCDFVTSCWYKGLCRHDYREDSELKASCAIQLALI